MKKNILQITIIIFLINSSSSQLCSQTKKIPDQLNKKVITVIGTGYVGLVTGAGLAEFGNTVTCADIDVQKISRLQQGEIPIYEPGLEELVARNVAAKRIFFTTDVAQAIQNASIIFIAVNTPMSDDGSADLSAIKNVAHSIAQHINNYKIIVVKSTVPVGTGKQIRNLLDQQGVSPTLFSTVCKSIPCC